METERMDQLISDFAEALENTEAVVHGLASISYTDDDGYMTRRTLIDPEIPKDVFIDAFASFFWVYVAEAGLDAEQTAGLIDRILYTASERADEGEREEDTDSGPAAEFRVLASRFMEDLRDRFGDVKSLVGISWNDTSDDLVCSTRCTEQLSPDELSELLAAFVISLVASGQLSTEQAKSVFADAASRADRQYDGLQEYMDYMNRPRER